MRRAGDTFRKICRALIEASEGKNVAYISQIDRSKRHYFEMAASIVYAALTSDIKIIPEGRTIVFPSGGRLEFITATDVDMKRRGVTLSEINDD